MTELRKSLYRSFHFLLITLFALFWASRAEAQYGNPQMPQGQVAGRQVHVTSSPPGVRLATNTQRIPMRTPATVNVPNGQYGALTLNAAGFQRLHVPIQAGYGPVSVHVEMSRPVFQWGIALTSVSAVFLGLGFAFLGMEAGEASENREEYAESYPDRDIGDVCEEFEDRSNCYGDEATAVFTANLIVGGCFLVAGMLMMILDRNRRSRYSFSQTQGVAPAPAY